MSNSLPFFENLEPGSSPPACNSNSCSLNSSRSSPYNTLTSYAQLPNKSCLTKNKRKRTTDSETGCDASFDEDNAQTVKKLKHSAHPEYLSDEFNNLDWEANQSGDLSEVDIFADSENACGSDSEKLTLTPMEVAQRLITNKWFTFDDHLSMPSKLEEIKTALCKIEKFLLYFNSWLGLEESQLLGSFLVLIDRIVQKMGRQHVSRYFDTFIVIALVTCKTFSEYKWKMAHFKSLWESISGWTGEQTGVTQEWWEYAEVQAFEVLDWDVIITTEEIEDLLSQGRGKL